MKKTNVLCSSYQGHVEVLAVGNDLDKLRNILRKAARHVVSTGEYNTPSRKELKAEILAELKKPKIMNWNDGETEDLFRLEIQHKVPCHDKENKTSKNLETRFILRMVDKQEKDGQDPELYLPTDIFYEVNIAPEGIEVKNPRGGRSTVESVEMDREKVYVNLITYGKAGDGSEDILDVITFTELNENTQRRIYKAVMDGYDPINFKKP